MTSDVERTSMKTATANGGGQGPGARVRWFLMPNKRLRKPINPALLKHTEERASNVQNRLADRITAFAGSMNFVYIHILWFGLWIGLGVEKYPFGLLTMIVSLEAIFLSTFVMISQNRADARRQVIADQQWKVVQEEDEQNRELLTLSKQILQLTTEVRSYADTVQEEREQNQELLELSKQMLGLTQEVRSRFPEESNGAAGSAGPKGGAAPRR
jgi:uncharacterized membrane protein